MRWPLLFNRKTSLPARIRSGARFRSALHGGVVATAQVVGVTSDAHGIEHVRFLLKLEPSLDGWGGEPRILALASFVETYPQALEA